MVITVSQPFEIHFFQGWSLEGVKRMLNGSLWEALWSPWGTLGAPCDPCGAHVVPLGIPVGPIGRHWIPLEAPGGSRLVNLGSF